MANTYPDEVLGLLNSLKNPRYATQEHPSVAPVVFDGVLQNKNVTFVAHPDDPHDYGVETWEKAQHGDYGPIGPYELPPPAPVLPLPPPDPFLPAPGIGGLSPQHLASDYFVRLARQVLPTIQAGEAVSQASAILTGNGGKVPGGMKGRAFAALAELFDAPSVDEFVQFVNALDDLRFVHAAAAAKYIEQGGAPKAYEEFRATMLGAVEEFNAESPIKIKPDLSL
jgi:hypothetical protein